MELKKEIITLEQAQTEQRATIAHRQHEALSGARLARAVRYGRRMFSVGYHVKISKIEQAMEKSQHRQAEDEFARQSGLAPAVLIEETARP